MGEDSVLRHAPREPEYYAALRAADNPVTTSTAVYRVIGGRAVFGLAPGEVGELTLTYAEASTLQESGHLELVVEDDAPAEDSAPVEDSAAPVEDAAVVVDDPAVPAPALDPFVDVDEQVAATAEVAQHIPRNRRRAAQADEQ